VRKRDKLLQLPTAKGFLCKLCGSRKYPYSPHRRDGDFLGGGGFHETKKFKEMYEV